MKKLVAVLGAGASFEFGLPVGATLKNTIADLLDIRFDTFGHRLEHGDWVICEALRDLSVSHGGQRTVNTYLPTLRHLTSALPSAYSIDHFINDQRQNSPVAICGKLGISKAILSSERKSKLYIDQNTATPALDFRNTEDTWLNHFCRLVTQGCTIDELEGRLDQIAIISFNYDRCIEHALLYWIKHYYKASDQVAAELLHSLTVLHPYGRVGRLPWQPGQDISIPFGSETNANDLNEISTQIKTFTEGTDPEASDICEIREIIANSECLLFLGFAYYSLNLDLLQGQTRPTRRRRIFGTAFGISDFDRTAIASELTARFNGDTNLSKILCKDIFNEYSRGISLT